MNCHEFREIFSDYLDGTLGPGLMDRAEEHLAGCPDCRSLADTALNNGELLGGLPDLVPGPGLMKKLYAIPVPKEKTFFRTVFDFLGRPSVQPAMTVLTLLMIFFTFLMGHPDGKALRKTIDRDLHAGLSQVQKLYAGGGRLTGEVGSLADSVIDKFKTLKPDKGQEDR